MPHKAQQESRSVRREGVGSIKGVEAPNKAKQKSARSRM